MMIYGRRYTVSVRQDGDYELSAREQWISKIVAVVAWILLFAGAALWTYLNSH